MPPKSPLSTNPSSAVAETTSKPSTPMDPPHRRTSSDSLIPGVHVTPPPIYHEPSLSGHNLSPDSQSRLPPEGSLGRERGRNLQAPNEVSQPSSRESSRESSDSHKWPKIFSPRSWGSSPSKKQPPVPKEQTDAYLKTKKCVGFAVEVARIGVRVVAETGEVIPVLGLGAAATLLSSIWDAVDKVGSNRLACLRLTARCADFLLAIYETVHEQGNRVELDLNKPLKKLESSFHSILDLMSKLKDQPFWKRFVDREEIQDQIERCHESLNDCMVVFNISILMHIEKNTLGPSNEPVDATSTPSTLFLGSQDAPPTNKIDAVDDETDHKLSQLPSSPPAKDDLALRDVERVRDRLRALQAHQNELDKAADMMDLRQLLAAALDAPSDLEMQKVLQVARKDMPEAIRTFLSVLEGKGARRKPLPSPAMRWTRQLPSARSLTWPLDEKQANVLDGEHIESDIAAAQRLALGFKKDLPSWSVGKNDVLFQELIGRGFFSNVYKGTWRHRTIAIKVLERCTAHHTFLAELEVWKSLNHPNILRLYGASDPDQHVPWFLISPYMRNGSLSEYLKRLEWDGSMLCGASMVSEVYGDSHEHDLLRFMIEISRAMEYMHSVQIVHGDLKGANVLIDNDLRCVLADFGHSRHTYGISFRDPKHAHGLRWQSPEVMTEHSLLTKENDVYAFAITCIEIVTMGSLPWPMMPDDVVRKLVLDNNQRPPFPSKVVDRLGIRTVLEHCWDDMIMKRPSFSQVVEHLQSLMDGLSFYSDRQATQSSPARSGISSPFYTPSQQSVPLPEVFSDPPEEIYGSESEILERSESSSRLNRSETLRPNSQPLQPHANTR